MIDRDPIEPRAQVAFPILHQLACEGPKVGHLARILRRDCEPEMMPVLFAPFHEAFVSASSKAASNIRAFAPSGTAPPAVPGRSSNAPRSRRFA